MRTGSTISLLALGIVLVACGSVEDAANGDDDETALEARVPEAEHVARPGAETAMMEHHGAFRIPEAMRLEHEHLQEALREATEAPGAVGEAARGVVRVLQPHFVREEQIALPPLGLLEGLAAGEFDDEMADVLPLTDSLKAELPAMLEEHAAIRAALENLAATAGRENRPEFVELAESIMQHARTEEQVTYPAAILVGEYVRLRRGAR